MKPACRCRLFAAVPWLVSLAAASAAQPLFQDWATRVNTGGPDQVRAATVDAAGNLYVAAVISTASEGKDYLVLKINSSGQEEWRHQYNGPGNGDDIPRAIALDAFGGIFVTGKSMGSGSQADIATLRLTGAGARSPSWQDTGAGLGVRRYNGTGDGDDEGVAVGFDASGFIYVTGRSVGNGTFADVVTVKYPQVSTQAGDELWIRRYHNPGGAIDEPVALHVSDAGIVHVLAASAGSGTDTDWAFLKYDANGNLSPDWADTGSGTGVRRFTSAGAAEDRPVALVLDGSGNVYATGTSRPAATGADLTVLKLLANGQFAWTNIYNNASANGDDMPVGVKLDPSGDVVVAGTSVGQNSGNDYVFLKHTSAGAPSTAWADTGAGMGVRRVDGGGFQSDTAAALTMDALGNVIVTGNSFASGTLEDFFIASVGVNGSLLWTHRYDGGNNGSEFPKAVLLDSSANLFLVGDGPSSGGDDDVLALRFGVMPSTSQTSPVYWTLGLGGGTTLAVNHTGSRPLTYQWRKNGSNLSGQTGAALSLGSVAHADAGAYSLVINNRAGSITVAAAELAVLALTVSPSGQATLHFSGVNGRSYRFDHAPEISASPAWSTLGSTTGTGSAVAFNDPTPATGAARRFYRAVAAP